MIFNICSWQKPYLIIDCVPSEMDSFSKYLLNTLFVLGSLLLPSWNLHAKRGETKKKKIDRIREIKNGGKGVEGKGMLR